MSACPEIFVQCHRNGCIHLSSEFLPEGHRDCCGHLRGHFPGLCLAFPDLLLLRLADSLHAELAHEPEDDRKDEQGEEDDEDCDQGKDQSVRVLLLHDFAVGLRIHISVVRAWSRGLACARLHVDLLHPDRDLDCRPVGRKVGRYGEGVYDCLSVIADQVDSAAVGNLEVGVERSLEGLPAGVEDHALPRTD